MRYKAPYGSVDANASYVDKDVPGAVVGSKVPRQAIEDPMRELGNAIDYFLGNGTWASGQNANDLTQLLKILRRISRGSTVDFAVKGRQNAPPGSPAEDDVWIVGTAGSGAWTGQNNKIALYIGAAWVFATPVAGLQVQYFNIRQIVLFYNGTAWAEDLGSIGVPGRLPLAVSATDAADLTSALSPADVAILLFSGRKTYCSCISRTNTPPVSPARGDAYMTSTAPTGAWAGQASKLAIWTGAAWQFTTPQTGYLASDASGDQYRYVTGTGWVLWTASTTLRGPVQLAPDVTNRTDNTNAITPADLDARLDTIRQAVQFRPHVMLGTGRLAATYVSTPGQFVIDAAQRWTFGTVDTFNTSDIPLAERTLTVSMGTGPFTYHVVWYPKNHPRLIALGRPTRDYGGFVMEWLNDTTGYNPTSLPENDVSFDSGANKMLIGKVVSSLGVITYTPLTNFNILGFGTRYVFPVSPLGNDDASSGPIEFVLNWSRKPISQFSPNIMAFSSNLDGDFVLTVNREDRYGVNVTLVADYMSYSPTWAANFNA